MMDSRRSDAMLVSTGDAAGGKENSGQDSGVTQSLVSTTYQQRKERGIETGECSYPGCHEPHADDSDYCPSHRDSERKRKRDWMAKRRAKWAKAGLCTRCGKKRRPGHGWGCPRCIIELGRAGTDVATHVDKSVRIAARTVKHADGRTRFHGQDRRGRQSGAQLDEQDLEYAIRALQQAKAGLKLARASETQELPKTQRQDAKNAAMAHADHCVRFVMGVFERNRYESANLEPTPRKGRG